MEVLKTLVVFFIYLTLLVAVAALCWVVVLGLLRVFRAAKKYGTTRN